MREGKFQNRVRLKNRNFCYFIPFVSLLMAMEICGTVSRAYVVPSISLQTFFVQAFKIGEDSWKFSVLLRYILWDDRPVFMISGSNEHLQQHLEYTLLKPDGQSWWISKMQSDTLEKQYAIKFCFKLGKNATETYGMLQTVYSLVSLKKTQRKSKR